MTTNEWEDNSCMQKENCKGIVLLQWPHFYMFLIIWPYSFNYQGLWGLAQSPQTIYFLREVVFMTSLQAENLDEIIYYFGL